MRIHHIVLAALMITGSAWASDDDYRCDGVDQANAKTRDEVKTHFTTQGWDVRRVKTENGCFEVYALDDKGQRREVYVHPVTLEVIHDDRK